MKKSQLRNIIRNVIKEQLDIEKDNPDISPKPDPTPSVAPPPGCVANGGMIVSVQKCIGNNMNTFCCAQLNNTTPSTSNINELIELPNASPPGWYKIHNVINPTTQPGHNLSQMCAPNMGSPTNLGTTYPAGPCPPPASNHAYLQPCMDNSDPGYITPAAENFFSNANHPTTGNPTYDPSTCTFLTLAPHTVGPNMDPIAIGDKVDMSSASPPFMTGCWVVTGLELSTYSPTNIPNYCADLTCNTAGCTPCDPSNFTNTFPSNFGTGAGFPGFGPGACRTCSLCLGQGGTPDPTVMALSSPNPNFNTIGDVCNYISTNNCCSNVTC